ncbi:uncharacterized protein TNCT_527902 [Trichonephila clavata]|uniref:Leucine-rich repeat-containing protein 42 n=1 Tax=Trichonephila clavata TaxID=2740835 RepID=A0A8X6G5P6_TRICU|nr:uncharacterized protein TNCT_527902 [Trichonephila clavata]
MCTLYDQISSPKDKNQIEKRKTFFLMAMNDHSQPEIRGINPIAHTYFTLAKKICLNKLCLKKNCLRDESVRKITLPIRMFGRGPKNIEYLDLSDNAFTDAIIPWLAAFKKLQSLDLSGSNISIKSLHDLEKKCSLKLCNSESNIHPIITKGWATPLIQRWNDVCKKRRESRNIEKRNMYFSKKRLQMAEESLSNTLNIRTSKSPKLVLKHVSFFGKNIESDAPAIEFLQQI